MNHRITQAWASFRNLKRVLIDTKLPTSLRLRLFGTFVVSSLLYGCESWKLTEKVCRKLNSTCSKMLSRMTGREIADEARTVSINVLLRTRDVRWNWLGHILRMDDRRTVRQVLLNCVKPTQESILGDLNGKDVNAAIAWRWTG